LFGTGIASAVPWLFLSRKEQSRCAGGWPSRLLGLPQSVTAPLRMAALSIALSLIVHSCRRLFAMSAA
jgi:hypothetical protein